MKQTIEIFKIHLKVHKLISNLEGWITMEGFFWLNMCLILCFCASYKSCFPLQQLPLTTQYDRNSVFTRASINSCNSKKISWLNYDTRYNYGLHMSTRSNGSERKRTHVPQFIQSKLVRTIIFTALLYLYHYFLPKLNVPILQFSICLQKVVFPRKMFQEISPPNEILLNPNKEKIIQDISSLPKEIKADRPKVFFLPLEYKVEGHSSKRFKICQVPGDCACLFYSLAICIRFVQDKSQPPLFDVKLSELSASLRKKSVDILTDSSKILYMGQGAVILSSKLLEAVTAKYKISEEDYKVPIQTTKSLLLHNTWGGLPEIIALSNHYKVPIHVYELHSSGISQDQFQLKILAKFGSPFFDSKSPLQILFADGRFPNVVSGQQIETGDHFLALYPCPIE